MVSVGGTSCHPSKAQKRCRDTSQSAQRATEDSWSSSSDDNGCTPYLSSCRVESARVSRECDVAIDNAIATTPNDGHTANDGVAREDERWVDGILGATSSLANYDLIVPQLPIGQLVAGFRSARGSADRRGEPSDIPTVWAPGLGFLGIYNLGRPDRDGDGSHLPFSI